SAASCTTSPAGSAWSAAPPSELHPFARSFVFPSPKRKRGRKAPSLTLRARKEQGSAHDRHPHALVVPAGVGPDRRPARRAVAVGAAGARAGRPLAARRAARRGGAARPPPRAVARPAVGPAPGLRGGLSAPGAWRGGRRRGRPRALPALA